MSLRQAPASLQKWQTPLLILFAGSIMAIIGFGTRSVFGLFLPPMTEAREWSRGDFAFAMALQNLVWGLVLPFAASLGDRYGPVRVLSVGALIYAVGVWLMTIVEGPLALHFVGGLVVGIGVAFTAFSLVTAAMVRVVGPDRRAMVIGLGMAMGSVGQGLFSPFAQGLINYFGWATALTLMAFITLLIIPLAMVLPNDPSLGAEKSAKGSVMSAIREAMLHRGYLLLTLGFYVCGFHVTFITVHLPAYTDDLGLPSHVAAVALSIIGLLNIAGTLISGWFGSRYTRKLGLSAIYAGRALAIAIFLISPKTELSVYLFAGVMGLLWLSTVPLTTDIVARVFGVRYLATLFSFVFLSHQLGSFVGVWIGGLIYVSTGSYDIMWIAGIFAGIFAALIHLPIDENPVPRLSVSQL